MNKVLYITLLIALASNSYSADVRKCVRGYAMVIKDHHLYLQRQTGDFPAGTNRYNDLVTTANMFNALDTTLKVTIGGERSAPERSDDGHNMISYNYYDTNWVGYASWWVHHHCKESRNFPKVGVSSVDIRINNKYYLYTGHGNQLNLKQYEFLYGQPLMATVAHEIGHVIMFNHDDRYPSIMNTTFPMGGPAGHEVGLHYDEINAIRQHYDRGSKPELKDLKAVGYRYNGQPDNYEIVEEGVAQTKSCKVGDRMELSWGAENLFRYDPGDVNVSWYLSTDDYITRSDRRLTGNSRITNWSGGRKYGTTAAHIPSGTPAGTYWLGFFVDSDNEITNERENNNGMAVRQINVKTQYASCNEPASPTPPPPPPPPIDPCFKQGYICP